MNSLNSNSIFNSDLGSLKYLGQIKSGDKIDVYANGTLSAPYSSGILATGWRTVRYISGASYNRDDFPKIRTLMERCLLAYGKRIVDRKDIERAMEGLNQLRITYERENKTEASKIIEEIINYTANKLSELKEGEFEPLVLPEELELFQNLEASVLSETRGISKATDGVRYFIDKIEGFLKLKDLSTEEKDLMLKIKEQLLMSKQFYDIQNQEPLTELINVNFDEIRQRTKERVELPETTIRLLDQMEPMARKNIGMLIPLCLEWLEEAGRPGESNVMAGHMLTVSICKEEDDTYTVVKCNAGDDPISTDHATLQLNKNYLLQRPLSMYGKTVVEFGPLTREEAKVFISQAYANSKRDYIVNEEMYEVIYKKIFENILSKEKKSRVPDRRLQDTGNCGLRSIKEWIIFCLQKSNHVPLANELQNFATTRDSRSLPQEEIKPLR